MPKRAISLTLEESNLLWLRGVTARAGARSVSQTVDQIITTARAQATGSSIAVRSVVGTIDLPSDDADLERADLVIRDLFARSLARPAVGKPANRPARRPARARRG